MVEEFMLLANVYTAERTRIEFPHSAVLRRHASPPETNFHPLIKVATNKVLCSVFLLMLLVTEVPRPRVGPGHPSSPLVHLLPRLFPFSLFPFFHWLYLFSSFVHPFPFYQNSPTPFPGWRS